MNRLDCPFCGRRDLREFEFHKTLPNTPLEADGGAFSRVYERFDRPDESVEHWQHIGGCRAWIRVRRNPSTGEVYDIVLLGDREASGRLAMRS